jgi:hypothetical protein
MANIEDSIKQERQAMEEAEIETRLATRKWRQYTVWLARDSKKKGLSKGGFARRKEKAKLVWWASKKAGDWRDIDNV